MSGIIRGSLPDDGATAGGGAANYKGVRMRKWGSWVAEARVPHSRDRIWLGSYATAEEAARAFDAATLCLRGPTAALNFPESPPDIPFTGSFSVEQVREAAARHAQHHSGLSTYNPATRDEDVDGRALQAAVDETHRVSYPSNTDREDVLELLRQQPLDLEPLVPWGGLMTGPLVVNDDDDDDDAGRCWGNEATTLWSFQQPCGK